MNKINFVRLFNSRIFLNKNAVLFTNLFKVSIKSLLMMDGIPDSKGFFIF